MGKPDESNSGEIKCMALVRMIYGDSGWDKKMSYRLIGRAVSYTHLDVYKRQQIISRYVKSIGNINQCIKTWAFDSGFDYANMCSCHVKPVSYTHL